MGVKRSTIRAAFLVVAGLAIVGGCGGGEREDASRAFPLDSNLVVNPSFESFTGQVPTGWEMKRLEDVGTRDTQYGPTNEFKASGNSAFFLRGVFNTDRSMVCVQRLPVPPGYRISYSVRMKTDALERRKRQKDQFAGVYVRLYDRHGKRVNNRYWADSYTGHISGTRDWRQYAKTLDIPKSADTVEIGCLNQMNGYVYFDDVELKLYAPYPWRETDTKNVSFYYLEGHPYPPGTMQATEEFLAGCLKKLQVKLKGRVSYYYYPSQDMFREMWGIKDYHERIEPTKREFHAADPSDRHQVVHIMLQPLGYPPFGLMEGAYLYCVGSWEGRNLHMLAKQYILEKRLPAFHLLLKHEHMNEVGMAVCAPAWGSFCMYLIDRHGIKKFMKLYVKADKIEEAGAFNSVFKSIYKEDLDVVDRAWRLWVLRYKPT